MNEMMVPEQRMGGKLDLSSSSFFNSKEEAVNFYEVAKNRLLNVNQWDKICLTPSAVFRLMNAKGQEIAGLVKEGDYIRINIPGPGTTVGEGYDWVSVESLVERVFSEFEIISLTVKPSHHPLKPFKGVAHFFTNEASSTFQIKRNGTMVFAEIHGRNEIANNKTRSIIDNLRNTLIGWTAKLGMSYPQWKFLAEGLVKS